MKKLFTLLVFTISFNMNAQWSYPGGNWAMHAQNSTASGDYAAAMGNGTTATAPTETINYFNHPDLAIQGYIVHGGDTTPAPIYGGSGDTTNAGGGIVVLCARNISGYGTVYATGESTTGGGAIFLVSQDIPLTGLATDVTGYNDGNVKTYKV